MRMMVLGYFLRMFPARAGVVPVRTYLGGTNQGVPRVGGGGPYTEMEYCVHHACSPRERGWSAANVHFHPLFPGVPRVSVGDPKACPGDWLYSRYSPHERGWSPLAVLMR